MDLKLRCGSCGKVFKKGDICVFIEAYELISNSCSKTQRPFWNAPYHDVCLQNSNMKDVLTFKKVANESIEVEGNR